MPLSTVALDDSGFFTTPWVKYFQGLVASSAAAPSATPLAFTIPGQPGVGQAYNLVPVIAVTIPADFAGSRVFAGIVGTADATFDVNQVTAGGATTTAIGVITIQAGTAEGAVLSGSAVTLAAGDVLQLVPPASLDATLADIAITIMSARV